MTRDEFIRALDDAMIGRASDLNRIIPIITEFVAGWLKDVEDDRGLTGHDGDHVYIADMWCEEMGE